MGEEAYLQWFVTRAGARWWNDSANAVELQRARKYGATGVTTNPLLVQAAVKTGGNDWADEVRTVAATVSSPAERAEAICSTVVSRTARLTQFTNYTDCWYRVIRFNAAVDRILHVINDTVIVLIFP